MARRRIDTLPVLVALGALSLAACASESGPSGQGDGSSGGGSGTDTGSTDTTMPTLTGTTPSTTGSGGNGATAVCNPATQECHFEAPTGPACGNGLVDQLTEACDDGNTLPGDGCTGACQVEPFASCPPEGGACTSTIRCGNGERSPGEACDDGNTDGDDGCSADCTAVEPGYYCATPNTLCTLNQDCGDSKVQQGETCDDGNEDNRDGCSALCRVEAGYRCTSPGKLCTKLPVCGDSKVEGQEGCDDGGKTSNDGCSSTCQVEASYWNCPNVAGVGGRCVSTIRCGDGKVEGNEQCDDGNINDWDGCDSVCYLESGWKCSVPGQKCVPNCGDGKKTSLEGCDDGNKASGDGCSSTCLAEPGFVCATAGVRCRATVCGDGVREGSEQCDEGTLNGLFYGDGEGCSLNCTVEPDCRNLTPTAGNYNRACTVTCGDGVKHPTEACDDGNRASGDGCSSLCKVEGGFTCQVAESDPSKSCAAGRCLDIPVRYRDFTATKYCSSSNKVPQACSSGQFTSAERNPDFFYFADVKTGWGEGQTGVTSGLVNPYLNSAGKPTLSAAKNGVDWNGWKIISSADSFQQWYAESHSRIHAIPLRMTVTGTGAATLASYDSGAGGHFPLDPYAAGDSEQCISTNWTGGVGYGVNGTGVCNGSGFRNYNFTSELRYVFQFQGGEVLSFSGDDDVWVYINGQLTIDLGGLHQPRKGMVTLAAGAAASTVQVQTALSDQNNYYLNGPLVSSSVNLGLQVGETYEIIVYHADRHPVDSNYKLSLSGFTSDVSNCTPRCGDGVAVISEECDKGTANSNSVYGGCTTSCTFGPRCGDGVVQLAYEECDDGANQTIAYNGAGCAPGCKLPPRCGDGVQQTGEQCDEGAANGTLAYGGCTVSCNLGARCGDGVKNGTEQCDDGLNIGGYNQCGVGCRLAERCGDGTLQSSFGELCDDGNSVNTDTCTNDCGLPAVCGDGVKQSGEDCDNGINDGSYGGCATDCSYAPRCGDGVVQGASGEVCDLGAANDDTLYGGCTTRCTFAAHCGDGVKQSIEGCDDGNHRNGDGCTSDCRKENSVFD